MNKQELLKKYGRLYSEELRIHVKRNTEQELFKWFLASLLFGKPIQEGVAKKTYQLFALKRVTTPDAIIKAGWDGLVEILDLGGYVRYDFSTATKLLEIMKHLKKEYGGKIMNVHRAATNPADLERRLQEFKGVGPVTVNIFLRELRHVWKHANPVPQPILMQTSRKLNVTLPKNRKTEQFVRLECALLRYARARKR